MRHPGTKVGKPVEVAGYRWFDRATGRVDLLRLARDAASGLPVEVGDEPPPWLAGIPSRLEGPAPVDLARIDARARQACLDWLAGVKPRE